MRVEWKGDFFLFGSLTGCEFQSRGLIGCRKCCGVELVRDWGESTGSCGRE